MVQKGRITSKLISLMMLVSHRFFKFNFFDVSIRMKTVLFVAVNLGVIALPSPELILQALQLSFSRKTNNSILYLSIPVGGSSRLKEKINSPNSFQIYPIYPVVAN